MRSPAELSASLAKAQVLADAKQREHEIEAAERRGWTEALKWALDGDEK